jgi:hypothetical protein
VEGDGDPRHGTRNGYDNLGCHCPACTEAFRIAHLEYMHSDPERLRKHAERERIRKAKRRAG